MWEHTAIFLTWDEWGGFYDDVVPPTIDHLGLGIRVPLLTISPYTRRGVIDDEVGEFSTPLRFISDNWGLEPLTDRIRNTHNFEHVFDFARNPRAPQLGKEQAPTTSTIWKFPGDTYTGWEPGTVPVDNPL
jgi:phospholipase C